VPMGAGPDQTRDAIRLIMLVNDVSLRGLIPAELGKGFGFFQSKPSTAFSPVAVTPDELGPAWDGNKVSLPLSVDLNGEAFGRAEAGLDMTFDFPALIAHAAKTRPLGAGAIIGSGTVSNKLDGGPGKSVKDGGSGYSCIAEIRMIETINDGAPKTPFMRFGDTVRMSRTEPQGTLLISSFETYRGPWLAARNGKAHFIWAAQRDSTFYSGLFSTLDDGDLDDGVEHLLRLLGIPVDEAAEIAHRPLPALPAE